jgi:probable H4MPT-linked C1 transfer pathway protein
MTHLSVLGLDVGGANLKTAHSAGGARSVPFPLWKQPAGLADALRALVRSFPPADLLAVTMTGELCDCFETKRQGVGAILDAVAAVAGAVPVRVWQTTGRFVDPAMGRATPLQTAAANWLALATFAGRLAPGGAALLVDVGSTTTDVIPLWEGRPVPRGRTDPERLRTGELVYTGVRRTPVCALVHEAVAAEFFAGTLDVYLLLGHCPEDPADRDTADGRPATRRHAHFRLARMLGGDGELTPEAETLALAERVRTIQYHLLARAFAGAVAALPAWPARCITAGSGEFLARAAWADWCKAEEAAPPHHPPREIEIISLAERLGPAVSAAACAHAMACLAAEQLEEA